MRGDTLLYLVIAGLTAACGLVVEIIAGRMIAPYLGMSLYTWTAVIAVVLAGFSLGHWIGGRIAEWPHRRAERAIAWAMLLAALTAMLSLVWLRIFASPVIGLGFSAVPTILVITTLLFFPPSLFVGIPSPVLTKLAIDAAPERMGRLLGLFYAVGALGSIFGTLAAGFLFISFLGSTGSMLLVSAVYGAIAALLFWRTRASMSEFAALIVGVVIAGLMLGLAGQRVLAFTSPCDRESDYYCIRVVDITASVGAEARVLVLDHLGHGINLRRHANVFLNPYLEAQDGLMLDHIAEPGQMSAFFVGGGALTLPRGWNERYSQARQVVAEIDPAVTTIAQEQMWVNTSPGIEIRHMDARRSLGEDAPGRYDVIVGDAFHDIAVPQHLVTTEFFALVRSRLKPGGIYLMNVIDHRDSPRLALSIKRSLEPSFPIVELWLSHQPGGDEARATFVVIAAERATRVNQIGPQPGQDLIWRRLDQAWLAKRTAQANPMLLTDDFAPVDRIIGLQ